MADDDYGYLAGLSAHPDRAGDTSNFNPAFAAALTNAIQQARAAGLPVGIGSGFRTPGQTGSRYDAGGNSSHSYGLASDISGLDGPNGKITQAWAQIAQANGLHNPYGIGNKAEFNHWQLPPQPLEQTPQLLSQLKQAAATGNMQSVWNTFNGDGGGTQTASAYANQPASPAASSAAAAAIARQATPASGLGGGGGSYGDHVQFIRNYAQQIGLNPDLALGIAGKEGLNAVGFRTPNQASTVDVTNGQPWSFGDFQLNVRNGLGTEALRHGIDPRDPSQWQGADKFAMDQMKRSLAPWKGDAFLTAYQQTGKIPPFVPGMSLNTTTPAGTLTTPTQAPGPMDPTAQAGGPGAPLGTPGSTVNPPIPTTPGTTINSNPIASLGGKIGDLAGNLQKDLGKSDEAQKPPDIKPDIPPALPARNVSPLLGGSAGIGQGQVSPVYAQRVAALNQPMTWGGGPPGQMYGAGYGPQNQPVYGTSLMSQLQMLSDPTWMNQMAGGSYG